MLVLKERGSQSTQSNFQPEDGGQLQATSFLLPSQASCGFDTSFYKGLQNEPNLPKMRLSKQGRVAGTGHVQYRH